MLRRQRSVRTRSRRGDAAHREGDRAEVQDAAEDRGPHQGAGEGLPPQEVRRGDAGEGARGRGEGVQAARSHPRHDEPARLLPAHPQRADRRLLRPGDEDALRRERRRRADSSASRSRTSWCTRCRISTRTSTRSRSRARTTIDSPRRRRSSRARRSSSSSPSCSAGRRTSRHDSPARGSAFARRFATTGRHARLRDGADGDPGVVALPVSQRRRVREPRQGEEGQRESLLRHPALHRAGDASRQRFLEHTARRADDGDAPRAARRDEGLRERHGRVRDAARAVPLPEGSADRGARRRRLGWRPLHGRRGEGRHGARLGDRVGLRDRRSGVLRHPRHASCASAPLRPSAPCPAAGPPSRATDARSRSGRTASAIVRS